MPYKKETVNVSKAVGAELRENRKVRGLTAKDVGDAMGYSESVVCMWERGATLISIEILYAYCQAINVSPKDIIP